MAASESSPMSTISPACEAESSSTFMKNKISNENKSCVYVSLNTFPTAQDSRSRALITPECLLLVLL